MAARYALDCNLMFSVSTVFMFFLVMAYKKGDSLLYCVAGIFAGLTLYTYSVSYVVMPVMLFFSIIFILLTKCIRLKDFFLFTIPLLLLAVPLILVQLVNYFDLEPFRLFGIFSIVKIPDYGASELKTGNFFVNLFEGLKEVLWYDKISLNSNKYFFTFYPMSVPFFFYGAILLIKRGIIALLKRTPDPNCFIFGWLASMMLTAGLMNGPNINRLNGIFFAVMFCIVIGFCELLSRIPIKAVYPTISVMVFVYTVYFAAFLYSFFTVLGLEDVATSSMCPEAYTFIKTNPQTKEKKIACNIPPHLMVATALPDPDHVNEDGYFIDDSYICYSYTDQKELKDYFFNVGGMGEVYLVYRPSENEIELMGECGASIKRFGYNFYVFYWE